MRLWSKTFGHDCKIDCNADSSETADVSWWHIIGSYLGCFKITLFGKCLLPGANVVLWFMASSVVPYLLKLMLVKGARKTLKVLTPGVAVSYPYMPIHHASITSQSATVFH